MTREQLAAALRKADAAGNVEDARRLAGAIRTLDATPPAQQQVNPMVAMGQQAQQEYAQAGSPALPPSATIKPAPVRDTFGRGGQFPQTAPQPAPQNWSGQIMPLAEKAAKSIGGMIGGQRPESEALAQFGGSVVTDPVNAANTAIEVLDPFHQAAYAYNDADAALKAGVAGDWQRAGNELKDLSTSGSFAAMSFLPGAEFAGAPGRMARAAGSAAPKASGAIAGAVPEAVAAQAAPKPPQPMFTGPPGPAPSKGNFMVRRADQIVGGAVGATVGGTGDAIAAPGDGSGDEGGPPMGAISGAAIGIFGPRAVANASSRGFRAAARPFRGGASFDERVAAKAVREALRSAGIKSADEAAAQMAARYGDKPAAVADLTQEGVGTAAGLSRLPGRTGEAARARSADLLQNRPGRLFTDIEGTTGIDPANVTKTIDDAIRQASEEISPAYEEMFAVNRGVNSERLMQLMEDPIVAPYLRRAVQASESLATTAGQAPSNARTWDLVKRALDRKIEGEIRASGQAAPELMSARQAVRDELDGLIPQYKSIRDNADAPRMRAARKEGANAMGGRLSVEKVKKIASGLTGRPLTTMQAGMIEQLVPGIEKGQGVTALASGRTEQALAAAFGEETARSLVARVRADAALTQNASRINPNVGSVTTQAGMGGGGVGGMIAGAVRAVRNPTEAGLSWLSKSGAYSKQQRDIMGEMLLEGATPENLQRIFRGRGEPRSSGPKGPPQPPGAPVAPPSPPVKAGFGSSKPLDMSEAGRMQRAREQGFDVDTPLYHGGRVGSAESFDPAMAGRGAGGEGGTWFTPSDNLANAFGPTSPYYVRGKILELDAGGTSVKHVDIANAIKQAKSKGYDGIRFKNMWETHQYRGDPKTDQFGKDRFSDQVVIFDPRNIRSTNAAFDLSQSGSSKLLAGMGASPEAAGAIGGGAAGYALAPDQNGDGVVDAQERAAGGLGGFASGIAGAKLLRSGANGLRQIEGPPKPRGPDQATFGGVNAKTADKKLLGIAQQMEKAGAGRDQIYRETGWFKGVDGKWRFEIDDSQSKLGDKALEEFWNNKGTSGRSAGILHHKPLYEAYPEMRENTTALREQFPSGGSWDRQEKIIYADGSTPSEGRSVILHEGQHAVQDAEGFASGGSLNTFTQQKEAELARDALFWRREVAAKRKEMPQADWIAVENAVVHDYQKNDMMDWLPSREARDLANDRLGNPDAQLDELVKVYGLDQSVSTKSPREMYRRLAGETEARNVQTRRDFTPEERRARPPWTTQDVPDEQQIVRYGSGQANSEPPSKPLRLYTGANKRYDSFDNYPLDGAGGAIFATKNEKMASGYGKARPIDVSGKVLDGDSAEAAELAREFWGQRGAPDGVSLREWPNAVYLKPAVDKDFREFLKSKGYTTYLKPPTQTGADAHSYVILDPKAVKYADAPKPTQQGFGGSPGKPGGKGPPANALKGPPRKPRPVEARREAPRGNRPFSDPRLSPGENKTAEMVFNGYSYDEIADEMMTSVDVVKRQAMLAQRKLGDDVKLPRPGMGKRPPGTTKREAINEMFAGGLDNVTIAERAGVPIGTVRTYRSYWKQGSGAPVANVNGASYNPPKMPPRSFEADYPQKDWPDGPPVDAQGRLLFDMEGRPLNQNATIVGRSKAPGVGPQSEADRPLRDKTATIQTLRNTGSEFGRTPRENLPGQTDGYWNPSYADNGRFTGRGSAVIADDLDRQVSGLDDQELMTIAHELGHSIDFKTNPARTVADSDKRKWGINHRSPVYTPESQAKIETQLQRIYSDLNNAPDGPVDIRTPRDRGYKATDEARELWAEAIRAYMWDPNYIKTVAPDVAFLIRNHVNKNSSLRKTIQFNSAPIVGVGGAGLAGALAASGQNDQR